MANAPQSRGMIQYVLKHLFKSFKVAQGIVLAYYTWYRYRVIEVCTYRTIVL